MCENYATGRWWYEILKNDIWWSKESIYFPNVDTTLSDWKKLYDFLLHNFKGKYLMPVSNQSGEIYATAKTHKFNLLANIKTQCFKLCAIIYQIETYTYNASEVLSDYLRLWCQNKYKITNSQSFASQIMEQPPIRWRWTSWRLDEYYMPHMMKISYSLIFMCKKLLTILFAKFIQKKKTFTKLQSNYFKKIIDRSDYGVIV